MDSWEREPPPSDYEAPLAPTVGPLLGASASTKNKPFISGGVGPAHKNLGPQEKNADRLKQDKFSMMAAAAPTIGSKKVSSFSSRTLVIFGMLNLVAGFGLGAVLLYKSSLNSHARPSQEPIAAVTPAQAAPVPSSAPDRNLSEAVNQLKSIGTELTALRQDIKSLAGELAQVREAQQNLMAAQARKPQRPESRTSDRRNSRGKAVNNPSSTSKTIEQTSTDVPSVSVEPR